MNKLVSNCVKRRIFSAVMKLHFTTRTSDGHGPIDHPAKDSSTTIAELKKKVGKRMGLIDEGYSLGVRDLSTVKETLTKRQEDLPPRSMVDSYTSAIIPLADDLALQDTYITKNGFVRNGRLLEDMDLFAVTVVSNHIYNPHVNGGVEVPYAIVTLLVDQIMFSSEKLNAQRNIRLKGHVSWVGKSSAEVVVSLEQQDADGIWHKRVRAYFVLATRDATITESAVINSLVAETEEQRLILENGRKRREIKKPDHRIPTAITIPTLEEQKHVHDLYLETLQKHSLVSLELPKGGQWMENTKVLNILFCHPEDRNMYHKVFGGFLMRHACELAWSLCYMFNGKPATLVQMSDIRFWKPVEINSIVEIHASVVYTFENYITIRVYLRNIQRNMEPYISNSFYFTYITKQQVPKLYPKTYHGTMMYLEGKKNFESVLKFRTSEMSFKL